MNGPLAQLVQRWRDDAGVLRRYGHERSAAVCEAHAGQLTEAFDAHLLEPLSIKQAAKEIGYSESRLYTLVESGAVENLGRPGAPRIRRADLPAKAGRAFQRQLARERAAITEVAMQEMRQSLQAHLATSRASCAIKDASKHLGIGAGDE